MFTFYAAFLRKGETAAKETKMQRVFCIKSLRKVLDAIKHDATFRKEAEKAVIYRMEEGHYNKVIVMYKEAVA